jgi:hypothetical protein
LLLRLRQRIGELIDLLRRLRGLRNGVDLLRDLVEDSAGGVNGRNFRNGLYDLRDCRLL